MVSEMEKKETNWRSGFLASLLGESGLRVRVKWYVVTYLHCTLPEAAEERLAC